jgi:transketolase
LAFSLQRDPLLIAKQAMTMRRDVVAMLGAAGSGHTGGSLSCVDILATLYMAELRHDPANPKWPQRDRFILSKGHAAPALYAILARTGYFSADHLPTLRKFNSILQGHPDMNKTPGVEMSTGSLGQGLSVGCGMAAMAFDAARCPAYRVYVLLGDGELNEGQVWEAAMSAAHFQLGNLCALIDKNGLQIDGATCSVMNVDPVDDKWRAFGWNVISVNGHDYGQLLEGLAAARAETRRPSVIIANTMKGKGVSFMENQVCWHGIAPDNGQVCQALDELK